MAPKRCRQSFVYPILDTRNVCLFVCSLFVTLRVPQLDSEMGGTGELWSNWVLLIWENLEDSIYFFGDNSKTKQK